VRSTLAVAAAAAILAACGDNSPARPDARPDAVVDVSADAGIVGLGPLIELPLLTDPAKAYNHSAEVTLAAHEDRVVAAMINMHFDAPDTFMATTFQKRVAIVVSNDRGDSFGPAVDTGFGDQTTDPVVRAGADGTLWLTTYDTTHIGSTFARSADGVSWSDVAPDANFGDKQWHAIDDVNGRVYVGAAAGLWMYSTEGVLLGSSPAGTGALMANAVVDATGVRFAVVGDIVRHWDGTNPPVQSGAALGSGSTATINTVAAWSLGLTAAGDEWSVRATKDGDGGAIALRVRNASNPGADLVLSSPDATAFLPAATLDAQGRLHVIYYDTNGAQGRLLYRRSLGADLAGPFSPELVLDGNATPGARWYPELDTETGGRRVREYIDIVANGDRVHVAWTHAPTAPSRVYTRWIEPDRL
jgi:hypothetical protein